jgi:predicted metal-dependent peptidase
MLDDTEKNGTPEQKEKLKQLMDDRNFNITYRFEDGDIDEQGNLQDGHQLSQGDIDKAAAQQRMNLQDYLNEAVRSAKARGHLPGWISEVIEDWFDVGAPNWATLLRAAIATGEMASRKSSWVRPNRRLVGMKQYRNISTFPGKRRDPGYRIVSIVDTSGSMDKDALKECLGVIWKMVSQNEEYEFWIVEADYEVQAHKRIHDASDIRQIAHFGLKGRGGTSFKIPIEWALKQLKPDIIVYCTDGYCNEEMDPPQIPVVWFNTSTGVAPNYGFGKVIQIKPTGHNVR